MAKRMSTAERQAALFGPLPKKNAQPQKPLVVPPPAALPDEVDIQFDVPPKHVKLPEDNKPKLPRAARYYGFRTRHSPGSPWTKAPGRWPSIQQAAAFAKAAQDLDKRLEIQLFGVE